MMFYYLLWVSNLLAATIYLLAMATGPGPTAAEMAKAGMVLFPFQAILHGAFTTLWMTNEIARKEADFRFALEAMARGDRLRKLVGEI